MQPRLAWKLESAQPHAHGHVSTEIYRRCIDQQMSFVDIGRRGGTAAGEPHLPCTARRHMERAAALTVGNKRPQRGHHRLAALRIGRHHLAQLQVQRGRQARQPQRKRQRPVMRIREVQRLAAHLAAHQVERQRRHLLSRRRQVGQRERIPAVSLPQARLRHADRPQDRRIERQNLFVCPAIRQHGLQGTGHLRRSAGDGRAQPVRLAFARRQRCGQTVGSRLTEDGG